MCYNKYRKQGGEVLKLSEHLRKNVKKSHISSAICDYFDKKNYISENEASKCIKRFIDEATSDKEIKILENICDETIKFFAKQDDNINIGRNKKKNERS